MKILIILSLNLVLIVCEDWCPFGKKEGGSLEELRISQTVFYDNEYRNLMDNRHGNQWLFEVIGNESDVQIKIDNQTVEPLAPEVVQRFSIIISENHSQYIYYDGVNCSVVKSGTESSKNRNIDCTFRNTDTLTGLINDTKITKKYELFDRVLFVRPMPSKMERGVGSYLIAINKDDRTQRQKMSFSKNDFTTEVCDQQKCPPIPFLDQMNAKLFSKLDSIIEYTLDDKKYGHFLWFIIDGQPMYCAQPEGKDLTEGCKSSDKLKVIISECESSFIWIIIGIFVLIVVITVLVIGLCVFLYKKSGSSAENGSTLSRTGKKKSSKGSGRPRSKQSTERFSAVFNPNEKKTSKASKTSKTSKTN